MAFFYKVNSDISGAELQQIQGAGYAVGGYESGGTTRVNSYSAIDYSTDTTYIPAVFITNPRTLATGLSSPNVGLVCGGLSTSIGYADDIDGIQFATETPLTISAVLTAAWKHAGSLNYTTSGYLWAGYSGNASTVIATASAVGVNFSTYAATTYSARAANARGEGAGISSDSIGYMLGGGTTTSGSTEIDGLIFASVTSTNPAAALSSARRGNAGIDNAKSGYSLAGTPTTASSASSAIYGFEMPTTTVFSVSATTGQVSTGVGVNSTVAGYMLGGRDILDAQTNIVRKFKFLTQTSSMLAMTLNFGFANPGRSDCAGVWTRQFHNMTGRAYINSGYVGYPSVTAATDCIEFSNDSIRNLSITLGTARGAASGMNASDAGYYAGGYNGASYLTDIYGIQFSTEANKTVSSTLSFGKSDAASFASYARGYVYAGNGTSSNSVFGFIFGTGTVINLGNTAYDGYQQSSGFAGENSTFGWLAGGHNGAEVNFLRAYNLAVEVSLAAGTLPGTRFGSATIGSSGYSNAIVCNGLLNGTTWANTKHSFTHLVTSAASVTTGTSTSSITSRYRPSSSSSSVKGYISGTTTETHNFGTSASTTLLGSLQSANAEASAATYVNTLFKNYNLAGFVFGGWLDATNVTSTQKECYDFASEALYGIGTMVTAKANQAAASSVTTGYLGGGDLTTSSVTDTVDKFVYSTRTYSAGLTYLLSGTRANADGVNSSTKGYFCGGRNAAGTTVYARIEGITFADETYYFPGVSLVNSRYGGTGNNSATVGYLMGGVVDTAATRTRSCETLTFSTEARANTSNVLPSARANLAGTNSSTAAYYFGGDSAPSTAYTTCYKMTFPTLSTVTMTAVLATAKRGAKGLGNEIAGYVMGGANAGLTVSYDTIDKCTYATETIDRRDAVLTTARSRAAALSAI